MAIKVDNLDFKYVSEKILENINIEIKKGEFVGIIGPNASGKTTLLKNISKILKPCKGVILIENRSDYKIKELARKLAVVSDDIPPEFNFTVFETVLMGRTPHLKRFETEKEEDIAIAKRSMVLTNTSHLADKSVTELSSGEKQRVFIAQALTQQPKIILLDEPTSHLDINQRIEIFDLIHKLNREEQITVITILHDLNLASQYCNRLILLNKGKIFCSGLVNEVLTTKNIEKVYNINVNIKKDEFSGKLIIHTFKKRKIIANKSKIHIIGGSGNAISLIPQ